MLEHKRDFRKMDFDAHKTSLGYKLSKYAQNENKGFFFRNGDSLI